MHVLFKDIEGNVQYGTFCAVYISDGNLYMDYPNPDLPTVVCKNVSEAFLEYYPELMGDSLRRGYINFVSDYYAAELIFQDDVDEEDDDD